MNNLANSPTSGNQPERIDFDSPALRRRRRLRAFKDRLARVCVSIGGLGVLAAITLIFFYLAWVVVPLFQGAKLSARGEQPALWLHGTGTPLLLALDEQNMVGLRLSRQGKAVFFNTEDGREIERVDLPLPSGASIVSIGEGQPGSPLVALGLSDGHVLVFRRDYSTTYPGERKTVTPSIAFPYGERPLRLDDQRRPVTHVGLSANDTTLVLAGEANGHLQVMTLTRRPSLTGVDTVEPRRIDLPQLGGSIKAIHVDPRQHWLYVIGDRAQADVFDLRDRSLNGRYKLLSEAASEVTTSAQLVGGVSLLIGDSRGTIGQWFMARDTDGEQRLQHIRDFRMSDAPIVQIAGEERRKGFVATDAKGRLGVFHSTAHRTLLVEPVADGPASLALSPRADRLLIERGERLQGFDLRNPHPEVSWSALWDKVWYENYDSPQYVWQSTSAGGDFEPKLSLAPLTYGTLKAAFYAMLLAAPLAVAAAIYTAYFMTPRLRRKVKPVIELMEAMPTVILGFIAGLFLAPYIETHLPGIFSLLLITPLGILLAGFLWAHLPEGVRGRIPEGWESMILLPVILLMGWLALGMSPHLEQWLFDGDMRQWIVHDLHLDYDQRNALVVGLAMGFAVIPNIYSIAEDAVFSVPRSLTLGSLALGATPWQTLTRVVLLTASPGIFSALMIGMGRAVGETMIVLMATGNTPVMDKNLFEGMRTLAANIAVEMPESAVGSTHYRVLFLAALVLLAFTFVMNTLAELIRQRLRKQYSAL